MQMALISKIYHLVSPGVTNKLIIAVLWRPNFFETMCKYKTRIILTSNLHHGQKEVALSPEGLEFLGKAGRVATLMLFLALKKI